MARRDRRNGAGDGWFLVVLIVAAVALDRMQTAATRAGRIDPASLVVRSTIGVLGRPLEGLFGGASDLSHRLREGDRLARENDALRAQLNAVSLYAEQIDLLKDEVTNLRTLNALGPLPGHERVDADVVGFHPYEGTIDLSVGAERGIAQDMPVISADGLVGIVQAAWRGGSRAELITNAGKQVGGLDLSRKPPTEGLIRGRDPSTLVLTFFDPSMAVESGDTIVTSGHSEHIPRLLRIGRVISVESDPDYGIKRAMISPFMSPGTLKEVQVLK